MIIVIDNYDSFVFNIARNFRRLGQATEVIWNDVVDVSDITGLKPRAVVISAGPCKRHQIPKNRLPAQSPIGLFTGDSLKSSSRGDNVIASSTIQEGGLHRGLRCSGLQGR
ncbi:glutamine amidotransferase-related protein [Bradyrhizobium acaciae]|uniref:glutamine amidotransferase-related protein n=1 Tax=Bradyrhizobium acaciae TaxID=2683706 RepID=UPI0030842DAD|nr:hypothetical protein [Bradyrhizobium acaciae]